jgi:hypothetical protein
VDRERSGATLQKVREEYRRQMLLRRPRYEVRQSVSVRGCEERRREMNDLRRVVRLLLGRLWPSLRGSEGEEHARQRVDHPANKLRELGGKVKLAVEPKAEFQQPCGDSEQNGGEVKADPDGRDGSENCLCRARGVARDLWPS